ncbi:MAG: SDR family oxidoreductase [Ekhidna sp.]
MLKYFLTIFVFISNLSFAQVVLITGSSRGIGKETANLFFKNGYKVYAGVRSISNESQYEEILMDIASHQSVEEAVRSIIDREGKIDILINNAGVGVYGPIESVSLDQIKDVFDVNFFGSIRVMQTVLPFMRQRNQGTIINVSSIAAKSPLPGFDSYNSSKAALESLSESMIGPLSLSNIRIHVVEPGPVNTSFISKVKAGVESDQFQFFNLKAIEFFKERVENGQNPEEVARIIYSTAINPQSKFRIATSSEVAQRIQSACDDSDIVSSKKQSFMGLWNILTK